MDAKRRTLLASAPRLLLGASLASLAASCPVRAREPAILRRFFLDLESRARDLRTDRLSAAAWQDELSRLFAVISPEELASFIDLEQVVDGLELPDRGVVTRSFAVPGIEFEGGVRHFRKIFGMGRGRAVIPHGHANMVSCHFVLRGGCRLRQYDVLDRGDGSEWLIAPAIDRHAGPGDLSSCASARVSPAAGPM